MKFYAKTNSELAKNNIQNKNKIRLRKVKPVIGNNFDAIKFLLNMINLNKKLFTVCQL